MRGTQRGMKHKADKEHRKPEEISPNATVLTIFLEKSAYYKLVKLFISVTGNYLSEILSERQVLLSVSQIPKYPISY